MSGTWIRIGIVSILRDDDNATITEDELVNEIRERIEEALDQIALGLEIKMVMLS